jgi:HlyD family secretion protein
MAQSKSHAGLIATLVLLAAAAAGAWYYFQRGTDKLPEFTTVPLARGELIQAVTATGTLEPVVTVEVGSQISGIIDKVLVDYNSIVTEGEVVAHIDAATYESRLHSAEANLANAVASQKLARLSADRTQSLRENGLVPQSDLDQALAQLAQADAQVQINQASVESARIDLSRCTIYSPIKGIVLSRQVDVGKTVAASFNTPVLFTIANDLTKMQIVGAIAEADIGNVAIDQPVNFTVDAFPGRQFHGRVSSIRNSPETVQNVVTYDTIIEVRNEDQKLRPGMTANISVVVARRDDALRLPNNALRIRMPDSVLASVTTAGGKPGAPTPKPLTEEERRKQLHTLMRDAGFTPGSGPPSDEVRARMRQLAAERGIDLSGWAGRSGGKDAAPISRTVYRLVGTGAAAHPEAVTVKLGISDGSYTEVVDGLAEGDRIITAVDTPLAASPAAPASSPFSGSTAPRRF